MAVKHPIPIHFWDSQVNNASGGFDLVDPLADPLWMDCSGADAPRMGDFIHRYNLPAETKGAGVGPFPQDATQQSTFVVVSISRSYQIVEGTFEQRQRIDVFIERIQFNWPDLAKLQAQREQAAAEA